MSQQQNPEDLQFYYRVRKVALTPGLPVWATTTATSPPRRCLIVSTSRSDVCSDSLNIVFNPEVFRDTIEIHISSSSQFPFKKPPGKNINCDKILPLIHTTSSKSDHKPDQHIPGHRIARNHALRPQNRRPHRLARHSLHDRRPRHHGIQPPSLNVPTPPHRRLHPPTLENQQIQHRSPENGSRGRKRRLRRQTFRSRSNVHQRLLRPPHHVRSRWRRKSSALSRATREVPQCKDCGG